MRARTALASLVLVVAPATGGCLGGTPPTDSPDAGAVGPGAGGDGGATRVTLYTDGGSPIPATAYGQNYWDWVDWADSGVTGLTGTQAPVAALRLGVIRAGGNNNDSDSPRVFDDAQIDAFVQYCRAAGAQPVLQVPLVGNDVDGGATTPQSAADMVSYANATMGYGIQYWEIGNEPDLYASNSSPAAHCARFSAYAAAMRAASPTPIQILGPEISQPKASWLATFLQDCGDQVDVVTVHRYPFGPQTTAGAILADDAKLASDIAQLRDVVRQYARPDTPFGITEANTSWQFDPTAYSAAGLLIAPGTFTAGLWAADAMGTALASGLWTFALWNLGEADRSGSVLGLLTGGVPTPEYYAEQLVSANLRGQMLGVGGVPAGWSVYASRDPGADATVAIVLNKTAAAAPMQLAVDDASYPPAVYPPDSITLVTIPDGADGGVTMVRYTGDLADAGAPPAPVP